MKILDWIKGLFHAREPTNFYRYAAPFLFGKSSSGATVNELSALRVSAVYACVRILAESIASLPLHVYAYNGGGKARVPNHPLYYLLHDAPNPEMTSFNFRETSMVHLLFWGNTYSQIIRDRRGTVSSLYPLRPDRMSVERDDAGKIVYRYMMMAGENPHITQTGQITLQKEDVLHIPALGFNGLIGFSPIAMARNAIGVAIACEEFGAKFFENDARPSGILMHPGTIKKPEKLRDSWQSAFSGPNHGKTAVLEEGVKYETISIPPDDAQFLDTRKFQLNEIARIFRVPPHMLADLERATFSNVTQMSLEFVMYTLTPWIVRWEQALSKALFTPSERGKFFIKFNVDGLLRGDYETRMRGFSTAIQNGIMSVNEAREFEDFNPLPDDEGGNFHLCNGNLAKLRDAGAAYIQKKDGEQNQS